jgi:hypothetical protein
MQPRYKKRVPLKASVTFSNGELSGHGRVLDLTVPGCLVESAQSVLKGQYFQLQISLPELASPLSVKLAAVRWSKDRRFGLEFIKMDRPDQQILDALMAGQPPSNLQVIKVEAAGTRRSWPTPL